jgi:hypothetical protein
MESLQVGMLLLFGSKAILAVALLIAHPGDWLRALVFLPVGLLGVLATLGWIARSRRRR